MWGKNLKTLTAAILGTPPEIRNSLASKINSEGESLSDFVGGLSEMIILQRYESFTMGSVCGCVSVQTFWLPDERYLVLNKLLEYYTF